MITYLVVVVEASGTMGCDPKCDEKAKFVRVCVPHTSTAGLRVKPSDSQPHTHTH